MTIIMPAVYSALGGCYSCNPHGPRGVTPRPCMSPAHSPACWAAPPAGPCVPVCLRAGHLPSLGFKFPSVKWDHNASLTIKETRGLRKHQFSSLFVSPAHILPKAHVVSKPGCPGALKSSYFVRVQSESSWDEPSFGHWLLGALGMSLPRLDPLFLTVT